MNVKPGDLAILIKSQADNYGKICKILEQSNVTHLFDGISYVEVNELCWLVEFPDPVKLTTGCISKITNVRDAWLRPVSGLPDEQHTEEENKLEA